MLKFISEIGSNWNGDISLGKKLIIESKKANCNFVKFQFWKSEELYEKTDPNWHYMKKSEFNIKNAKTLKNFSDKIGIECFWSVFYPEAVEILESLDVKYYKIASWTAALKHPSALKTLYEVAKTKKPVIISMGYGGDKQKIKHIFKNNKKYFLYCIADYPTQINQLNFKKMLSMDGFSDHTEDTLAPLIYAIQSKQQKKLRFIEKHISIPESRGPDKPFSINVKSYSELIKNISKIYNLKNL